ncbi:translation initiation factor IF-2-like [Hyaena hyaena]|uniref:translation initiation factor IF-2-like n=1 Tax=Hyaena hyaena TaxID=95912 RepID=UPI001925098D|nr:translation initiation factor IF-2-like [Hyaena hyaena]
MGPSPHGGHSLTALSGPRAPVSPPGVGTAGSVAGGLRVAQTRSAPAPSGRGEHAARGPCRRPPGPGDQAAGVGPRPLCGGRQELPRPAHPRAGPGMFPRQTSRRQSARKMDSQQLSHFYFNAPDDSRLDPGDPLRVIQEEATLF